MYQENFIFKHIHISYAYEIYIIHRYAIIISNTPFNYIIRRRKMDRFWISKFQDAENLSNTKIAHAIYLS